MTQISRNTLLHTVRLGFLVGSLLYSAAASAQSVGDKVVLSDMTTFDGDTIKAESLKDRPVLVYFWASWCPTCVSEMPRLKGTYAKYKSKGFEILSLSFREDSAKSRAFFKSWGFNFPGGPIDSAYSENFPKLKGTPTWFLIDRTGVIRKKVVGLEEVRWELEKSLEPLL